jgi:hypothetical protein
MICPECQSVLRTHYIRNNKGTLIQIVKHCIECKKDRKTSGI